MRGGAADETANRTRDIVRAIVTSLAAIRESFSLLASVSRIEEAGAAVYASIADRPATDLDSSAPVELTARRSSGEPRLRNYR